MDLLSVLAIFYGAFLQITCFDPVLTLILVSEHNKWGTFGMYTFLSINFPLILLKFYTTVSYESEGKDSS